MLGAFNEETPDWLSFFMFTYFTDRDGKMQLGNLSHSQASTRSVSNVPLHVDGRSPSYVCRRDWRELALIQRNTARQ